jgi:hypothetical protein
MACVPDGDDHQLVRPCGTYTADLDALAAWCIACGVQTVALESTGGYWMPLFEPLEARGLRCCFIRASSLQPVPGRTSDVLDCPWMQTLPSDGLLAAAFRPAAALVALRTLGRHRAQLIAHRSPHVLHRPKALLQMHSQLSPALSDGTGTTGQRLIRALGAGERDPQPLAALRTSRCQKDVDEIAMAFPGPWRAAHGFGLAPALALCDFYPAHISACDERLERTCSLIPPRCEPAPAGALSAPVWPRRKPPSHRKNAPAGNTRPHSLRITGVALGAVPGMRDSMAQPILAEIGTAMRQGPDDKHGCSWLGLAPQNDISGGKVRRSRTMNNRHRAAHACRRAAPAVLRADCALGAFYRRLTGRLGPAQALVATAHKMARTGYHMRKDCVPSHDLGAAE